MRIVLLILLSCLAVIAANNGPYPPVNNGGGGGGGGGQTQIYVGNYVGTVPNFTPTNTVAIGIDSSNGTQWNWYSSSWH